MEMFIHKNMLRTNFLGMSCIPNRKGLKMPIFYNFEKIFGAVKKILNFEGFLE